MSRRPIRERVRSELPYVLFILAGLVCIVLIALSAVGRQGIGWAGADLQSDLRADYNVQPQDTLPPVDATRLAQFQATDEAALTITPDPGVIVTVPVVQITPGPTIIAQVTPTPTSTATGSPTPTQTPAPTQTPLPTPTATRTPIPTLTPTPIPPSPTNTLPPPDTDTPTPTPTDTPSPSPPPPTDTPPPPPPTDTPSPTITPSPTYTPSPTTNPPPPPPLSLTVVNTSTTLLSLVWSNESASDADFVQYRILRSYNSLGPYTTTVGTTPGTSWIDSGLTTGTPYYYVVRGADTIQESANSPEASGVPSPIPNPVPIDCPGPTSPPDCGKAGGPPDGTYSSIYPTQTLILDLGAGNGILNGPLWDFVYYERDAGGFPPPIVQMDWITVELSIDATNWYVAFVWHTGNEALAQNSNVAPFTAILADPNYCDYTDGAGNNESIPMGPCGAQWGGLWATPPYPQTGIAIDIGPVIPSIPPEGYRYIRIRGIDPLEPAEIDGIQRLN